MKAGLFYRIAAVLLVLFAVGHTTGFRNADPSWGVDGLRASMRSIHFDVTGSSRSYWDLRGGIRSRRVLPVRGGAGVAVGRASSGHSGAAAGDSLGAGGQFWGGHGDQLYVPIYPSDCFLELDYGVFCRGGLGVREARVMSPGNVPVATEGPRTVVRSADAIAKGGPQKVSGLDAGSCGGLVDERSRGGRR
jgi:hypothetical protein